MYCLISSPPLPRSLQSEHSHLQEQSGCSEGARAVSGGLLVCFNLCTCQGSSASYSNIHELGRYWITNSVPPLFSPKKKKKARGREEKGKVRTERGRREGKRSHSDSNNIPAYCMPMRHSWINILYLSWSRLFKVQTDTASLWHR